MKSKNTLSIRLKNDLKELKRLNQVVAALEKRLDLSSKCNCQLNLILEELFTNILKYAFTDGKIHHVEIKISFDDTTLTICVKDDGRSFNPFKVKKPDLNAPLDKRDIGGLGVYFIRQFADEIVYKRENKKNCITLKKKIDTKSQIKASEKKIYPKKYF